MRGAQFRTTRETLNLDVTQNREVDANLHRSNDTVEARIRETYCWLLTPEIDRFVDMKTILWDATRISGGTDSIVSRASRKDAAERNAHHQVGTCPAANGTGRSAVEGC